MSASEKLLRLGSTVCGETTGLLFKPLRISDMGFWVNYNELTTSSLEIIVSKGNHPQMALIQVSESL